MGLEDLLPNLHCVASVVATLIAKDDGDSRIFGQVFSDLALAAVAPQGIVNEDGLAHLLNLDGRTQASALFRLRRRCWSAGGEPWRRTPRKVLLAGMITSECPAAA